MVVCSPHFTLMLPVFHASWSGDEQLILTCSGGRSAQVWDAASGNPIVRLGGIEDPVRNAAWHPRRHSVLVHTASGAWVWDIDRGVDRLLSKTRNRVTRQLAPHERRSYGLPAAR